ncbi:MAG TPA: AcvB/VirJ family lysyl-phosphatidylglycerol hydrolase [Thermoanaerobaculia bacterium]
MNRFVVAGAIALGLGACATAPPAPGVVPVVSYEARGTQTSPYFVVFVTGDGGWRRIDVKVSGVLRDAGMPVVGILANSYFARERTPDETGSDLEKVIREYQTKWRRQKVVLVGYSRGAEALPFMVNRLSGEVRHDIELVALLGPAETTGFKVGKPDRYSLEPEVRKLWGDSLICVVGSLEKHSICRSIPAGEAVVLTLRGGHHFGGAYKRVADVILDVLKPRG